LAETDSTNRYLLDEARMGAPEGVVVVADHQSSGRGRLGRTWSAPAGTSLLMSVLLRPVLPPARLHLTAAAVALAARDACGALGGVPPGLKWPNDLVVEERKLAGVLAEVELPAVVVGLGLNLRWGAQAPVELPADVRARAVALDQVTGRVVDGAVLLDRLLLILGDLLTDWDAVARQYRRCCVTVGRPVRVELAGETLTGTAVDVTDDGHLLVDDGSRCHTISAADVIHLRPAP
jgi:BirA family transcriptional regulator, biotin operon repressor / biotin---[acetyl-CoA-carboxylase] ligase